VAPGRASGLAQSLTPVVPATYPCGQPENDEMPTYEYACAACQHEFEAFQSIKDAPLTACPKCGADQARRQISRGTGFILKGGGWYSDLYASTGNKKPSGDGGSSSSSSSGGGSSSSSSSGGGSSTAAA
jgi:putative FmdB family regulatory protein